MKKYIKILFLVLTVNNCNSYDFKQIEIEDKDFFEDSGIYIGYEIFDDKNQIDHSIFSYEKNDHVFELISCIEAFESIFDNKTVIINPTSGNIKNLEVKIIFHHYKNNRKNEILYFISIGLIPKYEDKDIEIKINFYDISKETRSVSSSRIARIRTYNGFFPNLIEPWGNISKRKKFYINILREILNEINMKTPHN